LIFNLKTYVIARPKAVAISFGIASPLAGGSQ